MGNIQIPGSIYRYRAQLVIKRRIPGAFNHQGKPKYIRIFTRLKDTVRGRREAKRLRRLIHEQLKPLEISHSQDLQDRFFAALQQLGLHLEADHGQAGEAPIVQQHEEQPEAEQQPRKRKKKSETQHTPATPQQPISGSEEGTGKAPVMIKKAWEEFKAFKELRPKTLQTYESVFGIVTRGEDYPLTQERVEQDLWYFRTEYAQQKNFSPTSINTYLRQFQSFLSWCTEFGYLPKLNAKRKYGARRQKTEVKIFTDDELVLIFTDLRKHDYRLALLCEFMYETGARPVDALTLTPSDFTGETVKWQNKITKAIEERPITVRAQEILREMIELTGDRSRVFPWSHNTLSRITRWFNDCLDRCKVEKDGRSLKHFRTSFKHRIRHLPFQDQVYLMRHQSANVTIDHYTYYHNQDVGNRLRGLEATEKCTSNNTA